MKKIDVFLLLTSVCFALFSFYLIKQLKNTKQNYNEVVFLLDQKSKEFEELKNKNNELIIRQNQTIVSLQSAIDAQKITIKELRDNNIKNLQSIIRLNSKIDTLLKADYKERVVVIEKDSSLYMKVPAKFEYDSKDIQISGLISPDNIMLNHIYIPDTMTIYTGEVRDRFLKPLEAKIIIRHTNKLIKITGMENIIIKQPKFSKPKYLITGFVSGIITSLLIF